MTTVTCPALILAAPSSSQGKTTITAALASMLKAQGKIVRVFKVGPDYLDPQILRQASGQPVEPLDLWMGGPEYCQQKLYEAAQVADIILIEGAMGIFDGTPSSADLAAQFDIPIGIVMDVKGMAQTAAAIAYGLATYRDDFKVAGLIANNCGTERHAQLIRDAMPETLPLLGALKRSDDITLPERHLGLVQAEEILDELIVKLEAGRQWIESSDLVNLLDKLTPTEFSPVAKELLPEIKPALAGRKIAIAKDNAFSFIYDANLRLLTELGAEYVFFSPINDAEMPEADGLWLPGGYPELHVEALQRNTSMHSSIKAFAAADKPILAECGGFLYCLESLTDLEDNSYKMLGLMAGVGKMRQRGGCQGMQTAQLPEGDVRGHSHHRSLSSLTPMPVAHGKRPKHPAPGEEIYRVGGLTASYIHLFFPSNPQAMVDLFKEV